MIHVIEILVLVGIGFGLGRVRHPANLKLANIRAEITQFELTVAGDVKAFVARVKSIL